MNQQQLEHLLERFRDRRLTPAQQEALDRQLASDPAAARWWHEAAQFDQQLVQSLQSRLDAHSLSPGTRNRIRQRLRRRTLLPALRPRLSIVVSLVACVIALAIIARVALNNRGRSLNNAAAPGAATPPVGALIWWPTPTAWGAPTATWAQGAGYPAPATKTPDVNDMLTATVEAATPTALPHRRGAPTVTPEPFDVSGLYTATAIAATATARAAAETPTPVTFTLDPNWAPKATAQSLTATAAYYYSPTPVTTTPGLAAPTSAPWDPNSPPGAHSTSMPAATTAPSEPTLPPCPALTSDPYPAPQPNFKGAVWCIPPVEVYVKSQRTYTRGADLYVVGEIVNGSQSSLYNLTITATFYDANRQPVMSQQRTAVLDKTAPGQVNPFKLIIVAPPPGIAYYNLALTTNLFGDDHLPLSVIEKNTRDNYGPEVTGALRNDQAHDLDGIVVAATFYDEANRVVDVAVGRGDALRLAPGSAMSYTISTHDQSLKFSSYTVQAQGILLR